LAPIISQFGIIAIRQPHSAGQKMCKTHGIAGGGSDCRRKYSRASPEACRWLIINLKAIRHDDPAMNKKNIFSLARKKNIYYIYTIHYFYKPTLFIA